MTMIAITAAAGNGGGRRLRRRTIPVLLAVLLVFAVSGSEARAERVHVAVAANFAAPAKALAAAFERATGDKPILSIGSTGQLFSQIVQGAPYQVFLAADQIRPRQAETEGYAVRGTRFTYAIGRLVLYSRNEGLVRGPSTLRDADIGRIAIANPDIAPYGAASVAVMNALGVYDALRDRIVRGNNVAQAFQFVETGNAELGFVSLSQVLNRQGGSRWVVPGDLYPAIRQDAVLLKTGADRPAAGAFFRFLKGPEAASIIAGFGYGTPGHALID